MSRSIDFKAHRGFLMLLFLAVFLRIAAYVAYRPALFDISDSWGYLNLSWNFNIRDHFLIAPDRPYGYPLVLWLLARPAGFHSALVIGVQQLAGLGTGILVYAVLSRRSVRRWLALIASGVVLLNTSMITLEVQVMPEALFTFALVAAGVLAAGRPDGTLVGLGGALLGVAATLRLAAVAAVPAWGLYVLWSGRRCPRVLLAALAAFVIPFGFYVATHIGATGRIGYADASGFFLYGRVAHLADCNRMDVEPAARPLCQAPQDRIDNPGHYIWSAASPARRMFPGWGATADDQHAADQLVGDFARDTIRARPLAYVGLVARDFSYFFVPGASPWGHEHGLEPPAWVNPDPGPLARSVWPSYRNEARWPAPALNALSTVARMPRWLMGPLTLLAFAVATLGGVARLRSRPTPIRHWRETLLFSGMATVPLLTAAATAQFGLRYLVAVAPLLIIGGALAVDDVATAISLRRQSAWNTRLRRTRKVQPDTTTTVPT